MKKKPVTKDTRRINVVLSAEDYQKFSTLAKKESRSRTNWASVLIRRYVQEEWSKETRLN